MAITYGMSVKEFWEESPDLFWAYRFSYYETKKFESEIFNKNAWLQGMYICEAMQVAINNCFSKQKINYPSIPYGEKEEINYEKEFTTKQENLVAKIKNRVSQVQAIKGKEIKVCSTTKNIENKGGGDINE